MYEISIVIPVYNVEKYLARCLDSVYGQETEIPYEVVIVDDGATDGSGAICDAYAAEHPQITVVIHQENAGLGGARNTGIHAAQGKYIFFVDSDDTIRPDAVEKLCDATRRHNADMVIYPVRSVCEDGTQIGIVRDPQTTNVVYTPDKVPALICNFPVAVNKVCRKTLFTENDIFFPPRVWYEDIRTTPKLIASAERVVYIDAPLYDYYQHGGSIMNADSEKLARNIEIVEAMEDLRAWFADRGLLESYRDALDFLCVDHVLVSAIVRVLRAGGRKTESALIDKLHNYTVETCPDFLRNPYVQSLPRNRKLVCGWNARRMYLLTELIFKIKG